MKKATRKNDTSRVHEDSLGRIVQVFLNADLRYGIPGLSEVCRKYKIQPTLLARGQYVVFVNSRRTMLKILTRNAILAQYKRIDKQPINLETIAEIPRCFMGDGTLDYNQALANVFERKYGRRSNYSQTNKTEHHASH